MLEDAIRTWVLAISVLAVHVPAAICQTSVTPGEARAIAKEAYIYGYPMVDGYRIIHAYAVDRSGKEFKASWNELSNAARVFTPEDKAVQTPNSDTPYSFVSLDLRTEPIVLTVPAIAKNRYFSVQLIDLYTHNFAYIGSRTTGNDGGSFMIAGPRWKGPKPPASSRSSLRKPTSCSRSTARNYSIQATWTTCVTCRRDTRFGRCRSSWASARLSPLHQSTS
jgi:hypothetical protein